MNYQYNISLFIITRSSKYLCDTQMIFPVVAQAKNEDKHASSASLNISIICISPIEENSGDIEGEATLQPGKPAYIFYFEPAFLL